MLHVGLLTLFKVLLLQQPLTQVFMCSGAQHTQLSCGPALSFASFSTLHGLPGQRWYNSEAFQQEHHESTRWMWPPAGTRRRSSTGAHQCHQLPGCVVRAAMATLLATSAARHPALMSLCHSGKNVLPPLFATFCYVVPTCWLPVTHRELFSLPVLCIVRFKSIVGYNYYSSMTWTTQKISSN